MVLRRVHDQALRARPDRPVLHPRRQPRVQAEVGNAYAGYPDRAGHARYGADVVRELEVERLAVLGVLTGWVGLHDGHAYGLDLESNSQLLPLRDLFHVPGHQRGDPVPRRDADRSITDSFCARDPHPQQHLLHLASFWRDLHGNWQLGVRPWILKGKFLPLPSEERDRMGLRQRHLRALCLVDKNEATRGEHEQKGPVGLGDRDCDSRGLRTLQDEGIQAGLPHVQYRAPRGLGRLGAHPKMQQRPLPLGPVAALAPGGHHRRGGAAPAGG
mmetsp:Transcript_113029/g.258921  ORF Transcript_113029/g.258921 Transcript_113029/m.258921 type:complete len:272 (+) Transcript_113029:2637-3452(+)